MMAPTYPPKAGTVIARVLDALLRGERLTGSDAWREYNTSRLSAVVHQLAQKYGWPIQADKLSVLTADGRKAHVALYYMQPDFLAWRRIRGGGNG